MSEPEGSLYKSLSKTEQQELLAAFKESEDEANLIPHEEVKQKYIRFLSVKPTK